MIRICPMIFGLVIFSVFQPVHADTFYIDFQGTDQGDTDHILRVAGTIDVDLVTDVVLGSNLEFFHEDDPPVPLPAIPTVVGDIDFFAIGNELFFECGGPDDANIDWHTFNQNSEGHSFSISTHKDIFIDLCISDIYARYSYVIPPFQEVNEEVLDIALEPLLLGTAAGVMLGDVNQDGAVDFLDISPFIGILTSGVYLEEADIDQSGTVDFLDIGPFILLLIAQ